MKKLSLGINDRLLIKNVMSMVQGNLVVIKQALKIIELIDFSEKEEKSIGMKRADGFVHWDNKKYNDKDFEFEDNDFDYLKETLNNKQDYLVDKRTVNFLEKLNSL